MTAARGNASAAAPTPSAPIVVAVLAAGRSSRMGFPKALARLGEETALERILRLADEAALPTLVVLGFHADAIRASLAVAGADRSVRWVVNEAPERGQSSSIRAAARALAPDQSLCLWPVDHARVEATTLARLLHSFRSRAPGIELVVPSCEGRRGHPLFASPTACREFATLGDDEPAHAIVRREPARVDHVVVSDPMVVADFDRPEDLETNGDGAGGFPGTRETRGRR